MPGCGLSCLSISLYTNKQYSFLSIYFLARWLQGGEAGLVRRGFGWLVGGAASASWFIKKNQVFSSCMKLYLFINSFFYPSSFRFGFSPVLFPNITSRPGNRTGSVLRRLGCVRGGNDIPHLVSLPLFLLQRSLIFLPPPHTLRSTGLCSVVSS